MSDQSDVPAVEPEEAAQDAAVEAASPPWGDEFDAQRAWDTIQKLRPFEKQAKEFERIKSDEAARTEFLKGLGYEVAEDDAPDTEEDDLEFEDDDPVAPLRSELDEIKTWKQQQEAEKTAAQIRSDLDAIHGESDWTLDDKARRWIVSEAAQDPKGFDRAALERAHKDLIDQWEAIAAQGVERAKKPKPKAPHVTAAGSAATGTPNIVDMTPEEHRAWARQRYVAKGQGG